MWRNLLVALVGAVTAGVAQPALDHTRQARLVDSALLFLPRGDTLAVAASGFHEPMASLLWVRVVLTFGERYGKDDSAEWRAWFAGGVLAVNTLDPQWRTAYFYGGGMLRSMGELDASSVVFERCTEALPADGWCPFSRGMNAYLYEKDRALAARWMRIAAERPNAAKWWSAAAARMGSEEGARESALVYLESQLREAQTESEIRYLELQKRRIVHDQAVDRWAAACRARFLETGALPASPAVLGELGFELPENPRGDAWVVGNDGIVRSEGAEAERRRKTLQKERLLVMKRR